MTLSNFAGLMGSTGLSSFAGVTGSAGVVSADGVLSQEYSFLSALPLGFTYARNDAVATRRNSSGDMVSVTNNSPRFNHDTSGTPLGILIESSRTNLFTNFSAVPTATTGFTASGGTLSVTTDSTALTAAKLNTLVTGNVFSFANASGSTQTVDFPGTTGSTSNCSFSVWARITVGTSCTLTHTGTSPGTTTISGSTWQRFLLQNQTISATTVQMRLSVPTGTTVLFILPQIEVGAFCTSEIVTAGAAAPRLRDDLRCSNLSLLPVYSVSQGCAVVDLTFNEIVNHPSSHGVALAQGTGFFNYIGAYITVGRSKTRSRSYVNSIATSMDTADMGSVDKSGTGGLVRFPMGISWQDGSQLLAMSGAGRYISASGLSAWPVKPDRLLLGQRNASEELNGHIRSLTLYNKFRTPSQVATALVKAGENVFLTCGQSNQRGWFSAQTVSTNGGEKAAIAVFDQYYPSTRNWMMDGATNATSAGYITGISTDDDYWINTTTGEKGAPFRLFLEAQGACAAGNQLGIFDASGESDAGNHTEEKWKEIQTTKWDIMGASSSRPVVQTLLGWRDPEAGGTYQNIREWSKEIAIENPSYVHTGPEKIDLPMVDVIHLTDAGYSTHATRATRRMMQVLGKSVSGSVMGPRIHSVGGSGTTITVDIEYDPGGGTDFTPTSAISGFTFHDNAPDAVTPVPIAITAAVRTSATRITLTLASSPSSAARTLYYWYGSGFSYTIANLVKDNSSQAMPLRSATFTTTDSGTTWTDALNEPYYSLSTLFGAGLHAWWDATNATSYTGSGSTWVNLASPGTLDLTLNSMTFNGTAGCRGAYFSTAGAGYMTGTATSFTNNMHKTTGGQDHTFLFIGQLNATAATRSLLATNNSISTIGMRYQHIDLTFGSGPDTIRSYQRGVGNGLDTNGANTNIPSGQNVVLGMGRAHGTTTNGYFIGNSTRISNSVAFSATTTDPSGFALFGEPDGGDLMGSGARIIEAALVNTLLTDAQMEQFIRYAEYKHGALRL